MRNLLCATVMIFAALSAHALDGDMEARCREIDQTGAGYGACLCSEPLITNGSWTVGFYNPPGSTTKECGYSTKGRPLYLANPQTSVGFVVPSGTSSVPVGSGIPYVFHQKPGTTNSNTAVFEGVLGDGRSVPSNIGKVCHRFVLRYSPDWKAKDAVDPYASIYPTQCQADKLSEMNPTNFPPQYQWIVYDPSVTPTAFDLYYSGSPGAATLGGTNTMTLRDCQDNWCSFEQCWQGNFATGQISPIARQSVIGPNGTLLKDEVRTWPRAALSVPAPVKFAQDWIMNLYKQNVCGGERWMAYAAEAWFTTADDGTAKHGPWIGPPAEFTGSGSTPPVLGMPGQPTLVP